LSLLGALTRHATFWDELTDHPEVIWGALLAGLIVILLTPAVGGMARLLGAVDEPGGRRLHKRPIPRLGGLAVFLGVLVPALAFLHLSSETRGILLGMAVATTVGAIDDFRGLRPWEKLGGQVGAAAIPVAFGIWVDHFTLPLIGVHGVSPWVGKPLTIAWIVAIMNMVNFLDGLDGLAAGVCAIAGGTFSVIALSLAKPDAAIMSAIVLGACLGFLAFPLIVLAVPILDTGFVVARRLKYRQAPWRADAQHLHYRFLNIGFSQRRATVTIWLWCASLAAAALGTRFLPIHEHGRWHAGPTIAAAALGVVALAASVYVVYLLEIVKLANPRIRRRVAEQRRQAEQERKTA
jgi:UDP-GlcNAc:undecaprenyl-phosphate GlcNAc-1-phosphate transferase